MNLIRKITISCLIGLSLGAAIATLGPGLFFPGWIAASILSTICVFLLLTGWEWSDREKSLGIMMVVAFMVRLVLGIGVSLALPEHGYDQPAQNAGYLFFDSHQRDMEAWGLVKDSRPLWDVLWIEFDTDQYGGLLLLSGSIYRGLSPDAHRPFLIVILSSFTIAAALPFFWLAVRKRWDQHVANLAAWFLAIYPDGILFGSSQMREPFLIGFTCLIIWGVVSWANKRKQSSIAILAGLAGLSFFSNRVTVAVAGVMAVWFWLEYLAPRSKRWLISGSLVIGAGIVLLVFYSWEWLHVSSMWDFILTERNSGRVQSAIGEIGTAFRIPFITLYGLAQPVLPAAIAAPSLPIWKVIAIFRAAGWYALAPLLLYGLYTFWKVKDKQERKVLAWFAISILFWLILSSARAGGDQWDNPRYRMIFLPFMSIFSAWAVSWAVTKKDFWLVRWLTVELIFLAYFTSWYFSRYFQIGKRMPFWQMVSWIIILSALVLASGWLWNVIKSLYHKKQIKGPKI